MFGFNTMGKDHLCIQHKKEMINLVKGDIVIEYFINKHPLGFNNIGSI